MPCLLDAVCRCQVLAASEGYVELSFIDLEVCEHIALATPAQPL